MTKRIGKKRVPLDEKIDEYFAAKERVHKAFGYKADWVEIPMDDQRGRHWMITGGEGHGGHLTFADAPLTTEMFTAARESVETAVDTGSDIPESTDTDFYGGPIYTQRFLKKWVYRTKTHVMVCYDTQTDGNKFLVLLDARLECTDEEVKNAYLDW